jgi:crossover junction endodeoxyribonuclease RuvC
MLVIGIDPGTATTGYGFIQTNEVGSLQAIEYGVIETSPKLPAHQRLLKIFNQLQKMIDLHQPDSGAVEKLFFQRNVKTAISVGQGRGVAMLALAEAGITMAEYSPLEIKQAVAGYGRADKFQVQNMVKALLSLDDLPSPDDAADALAVAICHIHSEKLKALINGNQ